MKTEESVQIVEPDRVRKEVYTDAADLRARDGAHPRDACGSTAATRSQVPKAGDYYTVQIGRQPMIMVRGEDGKVQRALQPLPAPRQHDRAATARATPASSSAAPTTPGPSTTTAS